MKELESKEWGFTMHQQSELATAIRTHLLERFPGEKDSKYIKFAADEYDADMQMHNSIGYNKAIQECRKIVGWK